VPCAEWSFAAAAYIDHVLGGLMSVPDRVDDLVASSAAVGDPRSRRAKYCSGRRSIRRLRAWDDGVRVGIIFSALLR
jgi:hypothetical protein